MKKILICLSLMMMFLTACGQERENTIELKDFIIQNHDFSEKAKGKLSFDNMDDLNFEINAEIDDDKFQVLAQAYNGQVIENGDNDFVMYLVKLKQMKLAEEMITNQNADISLVIFEDGYMAYRFKNMDLDILLGFKN